ncbi:MAG: arylsulfatase [Candidatus Hydrogenedentota bacterium]
MKRYWDRRDFLKTVGAGMAALPLARLGRAGAAPDKQPNIIFIMADDMGYGDLGVYGQEHIQMPNVDQMAREGIRYTDVYAGAPVCAPSRSVLMTGQHTGHTRVRGNMSNVEDHGAVACPFRGEGAWRVPLLEEDTTVADVLKEAGYVTGITGKWGLGEAGTPGVPNKQGFDEWLGFLNQARAHSYYPEYIWENQERLHLEGNTGTREDFDTEEVYVHDLFTDFALDFIERHGPEETPFFLYLPYTIPHARWQIPELEPYTEDTDWSEEMKVYASMLTRMDRDVGRILDLLKELDIDEDTIVFFCSDNGAQNRYEGGFDSSGPLRGHKRSLYDGGIRTVMVVRWPQVIEEDAVSEDIWYFADVLPTCAELAGVSPPEDIDGVSVLPSLLSQPQPELEDRPLYWEFARGGDFKQAARRGKWKAVRQAHDAPIELYDLSEDIGEENDIAEDHPIVVDWFERFFEEERTPSPSWPSPLDP